MGPLPSVHDNTRPHWRGGPTVSCSVSAWPLSKRVLCPLSMTQGHPEGVRIKNATRPLPAAAPKWNWVHLLCTSPPPLVLTHTNKTGPAGSTHSVVDQCSDTRALKCIQMCARTMHTHARMYAHKSMNECTHACVCTHNTHTRTRA